jgi:hypothetical protein
MKFLENVMYSTLRAASLMVPAFLLLSIEEYLGTPVSDLHNTYYKKILQTQHAALTPSSSNPASIQRSHRSHGKKRHGYRKAFR